MKKDLKFLAIYLLVFYALAAFGFILLHRHYLSSFSKPKLEHMIAATSTLRDTTTDICRYAILGDPVAAGDAYVKINLYCNTGQKSLSTFSLKTVSDRSFSNVIGQIARISGFDPNLILAANSSWQCQMNQHPVKDNNTQVADRSVITCTQP